MQHALISGVRREYRHPEIDIGLQLSRLRKGLRGLARPGDQEQGKRQISAITCHLVSFRFQSQIIE